MKWYVLLPLVALASALPRNEEQMINLYYRDHRRLCGDNHYTFLSQEGTNYRLRSSGIPAHTTFRTGPYRAAVQDIEYIIPRNPEVLDKPLCVPTGVPIGFARNGVPFYNPLTDDWNNAVEGGCALRFDRCKGTVDSNNQYNFRDLPEVDPGCLELSDRANNVVFVGVALDGFPIYYDRNLNTSTLDECGGRYQDLNNKKNYQYVISGSYPYTLGCFRGKVNNISTLATCKGGTQEYGQLCACVSIGLPGLAVGYTWLDKSAVTVGECQRRPLVRDQELALICDRKNIPQPNFKEEDEPSDTCVDFKSLYSLLVILGHKGGLSNWTRLQNKGREEHGMKDGDEENEYVRQLNALRWLLDDLDVLEWPEYEKMHHMMRNRSKPLSPEDQERLRETLTQIWVVAFLREVQHIRWNATEFEREDVKMKFTRLMWVLKVLKEMGITPYIRRKQMGWNKDPWGVWVQQDKGDVMGDHKDQKRKMGALVAQLIALQALEQVDGFRGKGGKGKDREGGDDMDVMKAELFELLWQISSLGKSDKKGSMKGWQDGRSDGMGMGKGGPAGLMMLLKQLGGGDRMGPMDGWGDMGKGRMGKDMDKDMGKFLGLMMMLSQLGGDDKMGPMDGWGDMGNRNMGKGMDKDMGKFLGLMMLLSQLGGDDKMGPMDGWGDMGKGKMGKGMDKDIGKFLGLMMLLSQLGGDDKMGPMDGWGDMGKGKMGKDMDKDMGKFLGLMMLLSQLGGDERMDRMDGWGDMGKGKMGKDMDKDMGKFLGLMMLLSQLGGNDKMGQMDGWGDVGKGKMGKDMEDFLGLMVVLGLLGDDDGPMKGRDNEGPGGMRKGMGRSKGGFMDMWGGAEGEGFMGVEGEGDMSMSDWGKESRGKGNFMDMWGGVEGEGFMGAEGEGDMSMSDWGKGQSCDKEQSMRGGPMGRGRWGGGPGHSMWRSQSRRGGPMGRGRWGGGPGRSMWRGPMGEGRRGDGFRQEEPGREQIQHMMYHLSGGGGDPMQSIKHMMYHKKYSGGGPMGRGGWGDGQSRGGQGMGGDRDVNTFIQHMMGLSKPGTKGLGGGGGPLDDIEQILRLIGFMKPPMARPPRGSGPRDMREDDGRRPPPRDGAPGRRGRDGDD